MNMQEPRSFLEIGAALVNQARDLRTFADELDRLEANGDKDLGNNKGFKKARKLSKKARRWANKIESIHATTQKEAEDLGYEIQGGSNFMSACKSAGISVRAGGNR